MISDCTVMVLNFSKNLFFFVLTVLVFCIFHHAHILNRSSINSLLSKIAMILGCVSAAGAFVAGNCNVSTFIS